jgi:hypothetical protein
MKIILSNKLILTLASGMAVVLLNGCGTTSGYKLADKTGEGIANFREEIVSGKQAVDAVMKSLDQISVTASSNPRKAYEQYCKDVSKLESVAEKARKRGQEMKDRGQAYFDQWQQQMAHVQNAEIRQLAEQQKAKLQQAFDAIRKLTEPLKSQFDTWMTDLKGLQTYLGNDLTVSGVNAAKNLLEKTQAEGMDVQKSLDALISELNSVQATITPSTGAPQQSGS